MVDRASETAIIMNRDFARGVVLPDEIGETVAIEIRGANDAPAWDWSRLQPVPALKDCASGSAVVVNGDFAGGVILPNEVGIAIAVEVGHRDNVPACKVGGVQPIPTLVRRRCPIRSSRLMDS